MSGGGGGGGGGGSTRAENVPAAGPARALSSYPQYNPYSYMGMTPGALGPMAGMGAPIASYMPSVNGMLGFGGGIPAQQLVQALMAGYAGVPNAVQATGPGAPGTVTPPAPPPNPDAPNPEGTDWRRRKGRIDGSYGGGTGGYSDNSPGG